MINAFLFVGSSLQLYTNRIINGSLKTSPIKLLVLPPTDRHYVPDMPTNENQRGYLYQF